MVSKAPNQCRIKCFLEQMGFSNVDGGGSFFSVANRLMLAVGLNFIAWRKLDSRMVFSLFDWSYRQPSRRKWFRIRGLEPDNFLKDFLKELSPIPRAMTERAELCSD